MCVCPVLPLLFFWSIGPCIPGVPILPLFFWSVCIYDTWYRPNNNNNNGSSITTAAFRFGLALQYCTGTPLRTKYNKTKQVFAQPRCLRFLQAQAFRVRGGRRQAVTGTISQLVISYISYLLPVLLYTTAVQHFQQ